MAAPMLSDVQVEKRTIRSKTTKKTSSYKNVLLDPHPMSWPIIEKEIEVEILDKMKSVFSTLKLGRPTPVKSARPLTAEDRKQRKEEKKIKKKEGKGIQATESKDEEKRIPLVMGLNNVVRCVERGQLRLVVISRNVNHALLKMMTHLIPLCGSRECPAVCLDELQSEIAPVLSLHSLLAIGIKKCPNNESDDLSDLVDYISKRCPALDVPFLNMSTAEISQEENILSKEKEDNKSVVSMDTESHIVKEVTLETSSHFKQNCSLSSSAVSNQTKFSKVADYSDLYIFKDSSSKKLDFIQFDGGDNSEDEVITFTLPKTSKTREVNPNTTIFKIPDDSVGYFDNAPKKIAIEKRAEKRKLSEAKREERSELRKARIKQKKANPNNQKKGKKGKKKGNKKA